ncbi:MAG: PLP-dependent transferase [Actinomycetia bacterium]|nr:PLP-dependent transferase [Actinomycetes bacterium]
MRFNTKLLHGKFPSDWSGSTLPPIYQVSAFAHESAERLEKVFLNKEPGFAYTRIANPTVAAFERRMALLEGGMDAVSCSSGMAAVSMALLNILSTGDEIISSSSLFGGTFGLLANFEQFGLHTNYLSELNAETVEAALTPHTKVIFAELIGNPKLDVVDIRELAYVAERHGLPLVIDATTATPALVRPLEQGAHIVVHSSSKYINGSGDAISGVIVDGGRFDWDFEKYPALAGYQQMGKFAFTARLRQDIWRNFGACLAPQNAWLNCVGLETLGLRMERLCKNSLALAEHIEQNLGMAVNYPGLKSNSYHALIAKQMDDGLGGAILTLRTGSKKRAFSLIDNLRYAKIATNIGDVRTLVLHPASTIYAHSDEQTMQLSGVYDDLVRISVGLEDIEDLIEDFTLASIVMNGDR